MKFISSVELDNINGKDYLHFYLKPECSFEVTINGEEVSQNEIFIEAPSMSNKDVGDLRKVSSVIAKFEEIHNERISKELARLSEEERVKLFAAVKGLENDSEIKISGSQVSRDHMSAILRASKSYEHENSNFYTEFDRISYFMEQRLFRNLNDAMLKADFKLFDKLQGSKHFFLEEIFIEYVGFFFNHFPLESLSLLNKE
jgi:hypothetical protein